MFKKGTRVIVKKPYHSNSNIVDKSGVIIKIFSDKPGALADKAMVEFDEDIKGHDGFSNGAKGRCWAIPNSPEYLQPDYSQMKEDKILIMATDDIVEARFFSNGEVISGFAQCSSEDNFDFIKGAEIATARLFKKVKEKRPVRVGTKVKIISSGYCYSTYTEWVSTYAPDFLANYCFNINPEDIGYLKDEFFTVVACGPHLKRKNINLVLVQDKFERCFLLDIKGVKND